MERSPELEELGRRSIEAIVAGDTSFRGMLDDEEGVLFVGSDPDEWMHGKAEILRVLEAQAPEMSSRASIAVNDAVAQAEDDWGWAAFNCTLTAGADAVPFRLTEVFRRRDDGWKIVHGHASVAVSNEAALGFDLPT